MAATMKTPSNDNVSVATTNKRTLILLVIVFVVPVILAKLALEGNWFNKAATNKGELLDTPLDFSLLYPQREKKWYLTYISSKPCQNQCENALYSLSQIWTALGREQDRVATAVMLTNEAQRDRARALDGAVKLQFIPVSDEQVVNTFAQEEIEGIFIVDALGNIILTYPLHGDKQQAVMGSRDILSDMRKLLKLSRIG